MGCNTIHIGMAQVPMFCADAACARLLPPAFGLEAIPLVHLLLLRCALLGRLVHMAVEQHPPLAHALLSLQHITYLPC